MCSMYQRHSTQFRMKLTRIGFQDSAIHLIHNCLSNRLHRVLVNGGISDWIEITRGPAQGIVLGPILLHIYVNDIIS